MCVCVCVYITGFFCYVYNLFDIGLVHLSPSLSPCCIKRFVLYTERK